MTKNDDKINNHDAISPLSSSPQNMRASGRYSFSKVCEEYITTIYPRRKKFKENITIEHREMLFIQIKAKLHRKRMKRHHETIASNDGTTHGCDFDTYDSYLSNPVLS